MAVNGRDFEDEGPEDSRIAAIYRSASIEEPPDRLDILLQHEARRPFQATVEPRPKTRWWHAWRMPLAFASVAVLSVSVLLVAQREGGEPLTIQAPQDAPAPAAPPAAAPAAPLSNESAVSEPRASVRRASPRESATSDRAPAEAAPPERVGPAGEPGGRASKRAAETTSPAPTERRREIDVPKPEAFPGTGVPANVTSPAPATIGPSGMAAKPEAFPGFTPPTAGDRRDSPSLRGLERVEPQAVPPPPEPPARYEAPLPKPAPAAKPALPRSPLKSFAPDAEGEDRQAKPMMQRPADASAGSVASPPPPPAPAPKRDATPQASSLASIISELEGRPPRQWLDRVAALRAQGRRDDADAVLREFRRRFPYEPLPPDMQ